MVNQLDKYWDVSSWPQRYQYSSFDANYILVNHKRPNRYGKHWTKQDVVRFMKWLRNHSESVVSDEMVLYRGTSDNLFPYWNNENSTINRNVVSTSESERIAKEFSNEGKGYLHILYLSPGCLILDMKPYYKNHALRREKEVLLLPGHKFTFLKKYGNRYHWMVTR